MADSYRESLPQNRRLSGKSGTDFWRSWEIEYLGGNLFDWRKIRSQTSLLAKELRLAPAPTHRDG